jgi:GTP diphosphokinase / guanosine-3',5'-bis(diphosphate) 3'-diphosphatase
MRLNDILDKVSSYAPNADLDLIMRAYVYSAKAHAGQMRKSGEPYLIHPIAVAGILADLHMDVDTVAVGLLHDTMEDCLTTRDELTEMFGTDVADMVDGVTKIGKLEFRNKHEAAAENFRKLVLAMARDIRVILIKLADRIHNMRTMEHQKPDRQRAISQETLDIYAPIANRLGLSRWKMELEDLCLRHLHPDVHSMLEEKLGQGQTEREAYISRTCQTVRQQLRERGMEQVEVTGRPKHLASIFKKMRDNSVEFEQLHDVLAFRIFVHDLGQCYTALGLIHSLYRHVPERLKDYIANPKSNGYQSLHTVVLGPEGRTVEFQIRTHEMHRVAEVGIAAHWRYKEGHLALSRDDINKIARLRELLETAQEVTDPHEFMETIKVDLFSNEIFAFTPKGDVRFFPQGATVLDFAYAIHSKVGDTATGGRVNGKLVPLRHVLKEGETVEILNRPDQHPRREWLEWARTGRALSKIRRFIREEEREKGRQLGKELLESELKKRGYNLAKLARGPELEQAIKKHGLRNAEQLYLAISTGHIPIAKVLADLVRPEDLNKDLTQEPQGFVQKIMHKFRAPRPDNPILINGQDDVMVSYAKCCSPLPGEPVSGYITRGRGITVHVSTCPQLLTLEPERRVLVQWQDQVAGTHPAELRIICANKTGMLADIAAECKTLSINLGRLEARSTEDNKAVLAIEVHVRSADELAALLRTIEKIKGVHSVERVRAQHQEG